MDYSSSMKELKAVDQLHKVPGGKGGGKILSPQTICNTERDPHCILRLKLIQV